MKNKLFLFTILALNSILVHAQFEGYSVQLKPKTFSGLPGLQSFAWGKLDGKWILVGGRTDGLHRRQPFASFDQAGNNTNIYLVNSKNETVLNSSVNGLSVGLKEQLQSTNMQFYQSGIYLILIGGYGYSVSAANHITFPNICVINLETLIEKIENNESISSAFIQITDQRFAVTGGHLGKLNNKYYLVGGNRFDGRYNPMGGTSYTQAYTNAIRKFNLEIGSSSININNYENIIDSLNLHRRDYNLTPNKNKLGEYSYTLWSGVFQYNQDLPWLNSVDIKENSHEVNNGFNQYLNQYHTAYIPLFNKNENSMYTLFFGGISQYYYDPNGAIIKDDNVPFVKTISYIKRDSTGNLTEFALPGIEMPGYLGSASEIIPSENELEDGYGIFDLEKFENDSVFAGTLVGGINSTAANIFFTNTGTQSTANASCYEIWFVKNKIANSIAIKDPDSWKLNTFPNPFKSNFTLNISNINPSNYIKVSLHDIQGKHLEDLYEGKVKSELPLQANISLQNGMYFLLIQSGQINYTIKILKQ
ncbi:MAG: T9SS type A sorting domain-containing protein [Bacteroidia bacterium]